MKRTYDPVITVCDACFQASCWQGEFFCDDYMDAGIVDLPVSELIRRQERGYHEHPDYWNKHLAMDHKRRITVQDLRSLGITDPNYLELA